MYGTIASRFNDTGVTALYNELVRQFQKLAPSAQWHYAADIDPNLRYSEVCALCACARI